MCMVVNVICLFFSIYIFVWNYILISLNHFPLPMFWDFGLRFANQVSDDFLRCDTIVGWVLRFPSFPGYHILSHNGAIFEISFSTRDQQKWGLLTENMNWIELVHLFDPWDDWSPIYIHLHKARQVEPTAIHGRRCVSAPWWRRGSSRPLRRSCFRSRRRLRCGGIWCLWDGWKCMEMHTSAPFSHHPTIINDQPMYISFLF